MDSNFINQNYDQRILSVAFSIGCFTDNQFLASGTAVVIAPNLVITARHVIEDFYKQFQNEELLKNVDENKNVSIEAQMHVAALQYQEDGKKIILWRAHQIYVCLYTDIVFIYLTPFSEEAQRYTKWETCKIDLFPPKVGEKIFGFGFHSSRIEVDKSGGKISMNWRDQPATTIGTVIDYHPLQRDSVRINFPCFQTDARFDGGMSGGPVFNESGSLVGLICSTIPASNEIKEHISYVALIWPSLITQLNIPYPELLNNIPYPALELARIGGIQANGYERISLTRKEGDPWYGGIQFEI